MRLLSRLLSASLLLASFGAAPAVQADPRLPYGPDTCLEGFVWRDAAPGDRVCVKPVSRTRAAAENSMAPSRIDPLGAYGPFTCINGFVWREAFRGDVVCVVPARRDAVQVENAMGAARRVLG